tara:strand:+ start:107 stop:565 length:459 start_codon:yes stop_codon:yes gene_type:complete
MRIFVVAALIALFSFGQAHAQIMLQDGAIKLGIGKRPAVLHGVVRNQSKSATRVIGASSSAFERIELHTHTKSSDGTMRMHGVESYALPAMGSVDLKPGGHHLMLFGFTGQAGDSVDIRLSFADGQSLDVEAPTKARAKHKSNHRAHGHSYP